MSSSRGPDPELVDEHHQPLACGEVEGVEDVEQADRLRRVRHRNGRRVPTRGLQRRAVRGAGVAVDIVLGDQALRADRARGVLVEGHEPAVDRCLDPRLEVRGEGDLVDRPRVRAGDPHLLPSDQAARVVEDHVEPRRRASLGAVAERGRGERDNSREHDRERPQSPHR